MILKYAVAAALITVSFFSGTAFAGQTEMRTGRLSFKLPEGYSQSFISGAFEGVRLHGLLQEPAKKVWADGFNPPTNLDGDIKHLFNADLNADFPYPAKLRVFSQTSESRVSLRAYVMLPEAYLIEMEEVLIGPGTIDSEFLKALEENPAEGCAVIASALVVYKHGMGSGNTPAYYIPCGRFEAPVAGYESVESVFRNASIVIKISLKSTVFPKAPELVYPLVDPEQQPPVVIEEVLLEAKRNVLGMAGDENITLESRDIPFEDKMNRRIHAAFKADGRGYEMTIDLQAPPELSAEALAVWELLLDSISLNE